MRKIFLVLIFFNAPKQAYVVPLAVKAFIKNYLNVTSEIVTKREIIINHIQSEIGCYFQTERFTKLNHVYNVCTINIINP